MAEIGKTLKELYPKIDSPKRQIIGDIIAKLGIKRQGEKIREDRHKVNVYSPESFDYIDRIVNDINTAIKELSKRKRIETSQPVKY